MEANGMLASQMIVTEPRGPQRGLHRDTRNACQFGDSQGTGAFIPEPSPDLPGRTKQGEPGDDDQRRADAAERRGETLRQRAGERKGINAEGTEEVRKRIEPGVHGPFRPAGTHEPAMPQDDIPDDRSRQLLLRSLRSVRHEDRLKASLRDRCPAAASATLRGEKGLFKLEVRHH